MNNQDITKADQLKDAGVSTTEPATQDIVQQVIEYLKDHKEVLELDQTKVLNPTGQVIMWAGSNGSIPDGFLLCDGQAVSRVTYSDLFAVIGTEFGVGDGTTTFNVPEFRGYVPLGAHGTTGVTGIDRGQVTGAITAPHTHAIDHDHPVFNSALVDPGGEITEVQSGSGNQVADEDHNHAIDIPAFVGTSGSTASSTVQPSLGIHFIIKT